MHQLWRDTIHALRRLRAAPVFTAFTVISMLAAMRLRLLLVLLPILSAMAPFSAQEKVTEFELRGLMTEQHRAASLYRSGDVDEAVAIVARRSPALNHRIAQRIVQWLERPQPPLRDPGRTGQVVMVDHWELPWLVALGSLHMERALRVYEERGVLDEHHSSVRTARLLFDEARRRGHPSHDLLQQWILAIGSTAHADGEAWWAAAILDEGCRDDRRIADLLVACGAVHESIARLPAHSLLGAGDPSMVGEAPAFSVRTVQEARLARDRRLGLARRALETALVVSPAHPEARLRLASVLDLAGDATRAGALLDGLLTGGELDRRTAFLARLMIGRISQRAGAAADAVAPLRQAVELVPSAQSAYTALAAALHETGSRLDAAVTVERLLTAPPTPADPWISYGYGQYWIPAALLKTLREEARR